MKYWIVPSNNSTFRIGEAISAQDGKVDWRQSNNYEIGDIAFIYLSGSFKYIKYKMRVIGVKIEDDEHYDQERFWADKSIYYSGLGRYRYVRFELLEEFDENTFTLQNLREHGLRGNVQGVQECPNDLLEYLNNPQQEVEADDYGVDYPEEDAKLYEGTLMRVMVNKYERNQKARKECIALKGCRCVVCGIDFEETYGERGRDFIHVHHVVPISSIGMEYKLKVETDLVPVCPNCHYMLHRKNPPYKPEELKSYLYEQNLGSPMIAAEPPEGYGSDLIVGVVKPDRVGLFRTNEAKSYYFGRKFPSKYNLKEIRYFAPYYDGGIRGYYDVLGIRTARKNEIEGVDDESGGNDVRIVLTLGQYHKMLDNPKRVHLASYSYALLSLQDAFE